MEIITELEDLSSVKKKIQVEVPADVVAKEYQRIAAEFQKQARLPGFRPGKAPLQMIKRRYSGEIRGDVISKLVPDSLEQALREKEVEPVAQPTLENLSVSEGEKLAYEAHFEVLPEITLATYKGLEVSVEDHPVTDEDVQVELDRIREQRAQLVVVPGREAKDGDFATLDLKGEVLDEAGEPEGEPIQEEGVVVHVGDTGTHKAFSESVPGMKVGDEKSFPADYDENYHDKRLAGRKVRFTAVLNELKEKELPVLDDEFAKSLGEIESLADLKEKINSRLQQDRKRSRDEEIRRGLTKTLVESMSFEVPEALIKNRTGERLESLAQRFSSQGIDPSKANVDWAKIRDDMRPDVEEEVRARLIVDEIAKQEGIVVEEADVDAEVNQIAESLQQPSERVKQYFTGAAKAGLETDLRRRKTLEFIVENAKIN